MSFRGREGDKFCSAMSCETAGGLVLNSESNPEAGDGEQARAGRNSTSISPRTPFKPPVVPAATMEVTVLYGALGETGEGALEPGVILDDDWSSA